MNLTQSHTPQNTSDNLQTRKETAEVPPKLYLDLHLSSVNRIKSLINDLERKANLNLTIGITAGVLAIGVMIYMAWDLQNLTQTPNAPPINLIDYFIPRVTIVIFIEIFSYFFLRLYRNNLEESKYFHNELSNFESKYMALEVALTINQESPDILSDVVKVLEHIP